MEDIKIAGYYPGDILSLKKNSIILNMQDCLDAGGDWTKSVENLLMNGWEINEIRKK